LISSYFNPSNFSIWISNYIFKILLLKLIPPFLTHNTKAKFKCIQVFKMQVHGVTLSVKIILIYLWSSSFES